MLLSLVSLHSMHKPSGQHLALASPGFSFSSPPQHLTPSAVLQFESDELGLPLEKGYGPTSVR